jgi:hypothetical protein
MEKVGGYVIDKIRRTKDWQGTLPEHSIQWWSQQGQV